MIGNNTNRPLSSTSRLTANNSASSISDVIHSHTTSVFHTGDSSTAHATTSIFRVGNPYFKARTSVVSPQQQTSSRTQESDEETRDYLRYAYARKVTKRKHLADSLRGIIDGNSYEKIANNSFSPSDLRKIRTQVDEGVQRGALSVSQGKKIKYFLSEL